jgi:hypothetical protein
MNCPVQAQTEILSPQYSTLLGHSAFPTPLWNAARIIPTEQVISIRIDNTSVFVPGGGPPQYGFRRTEFIAQVNGSSTALDAEMEVGVSVFHFSIKEDLLRPLNYSHEYQIVFIEPSDGTHVFGIQLGALSAPSAYDNAHAEWILRTGSPFTDPTGKLPARNARSFKVLDHALNVLFSTPFLPLVWHNFAITVDWDNRTLQVAYSTDAIPLRAVTSTVPNPSATPGAVGDFHFGILKVSCHRWLGFPLSMSIAEISAMKLPLVNPNDSPADQSDVVHHGIQEGTTEGLFYSGVLVERLA